MAAEGRVFDVPGSREAAGVLRRRRRLVCRRVPSPPLPAVTRSLRGAHRPQPEPGPVLAPPHRRIPVRPQRPGFTAADLVPLILLQARPGNEGVPHPRTRPGSGHLRGGAAEKPRGCGRDGVPPPRGIGHLTTRPVALPDDDAFPAPDAVPAEADRGEEPELVHRDVHEHDIWTPGRSYRPPAPCRATSRTPTTPPSGSGTHVGQAAPRTARRR